ncbi:MAG TPA: helix-turn-helix domain-containing protein [Pyrinomonadaceae bacterium]|nr:helix-turn-helix domain-containing protein [Pyrinomonadaceae bacterium]
MLEQKHYSFEASEQPALRADESARLQASSVKIKALRELALALLQEVESLKGGEGFEARTGVNFSDEVRRFETDLIRWALMHTGGHQRRAARLLNMKVTTLNAKIKRYGILAHSLPTNVVDLRPA